MKNYAAKDVDAYIKGADARARPTLKELRALILATIPKAEERISWGIPFYRYHGLLAGFAAFTNHASFGLAFAFPQEERDALEAKGYKTGSKTVQIRYDQKIPSAVIKRLLKAKAKANEAAKK